MSRKDANSQRSKEMKTSFIIFAILLLIVVGVYYYFKKMMPDIMFKQGKQYYEVGQYDKALKSFTSVANAKPYDSEPVYYQALTLSKMPPTYENQKMLYDISQLEDCDDASELADEILTNMRNSLIKQVGPSYIDNVLYEDQLIRWNNSEPITYAIFTDGDVPASNIAAVKKAFQAWQTATNGEIKFKEQPGNQTANIRVNFKEDISMNDRYVAELAGKTIPFFNNDKLNRMDIYIKKFSDKGITYTPEQILSVAQHEIGHALGLGGHSSDSNDVMHYTGDVINEGTTLKAISNKDINTLALLYKMIPDVIDKPLAESDYSNLLYHTILTSYPNINYEAEIKRLMAELKNDRKNIIIWVDLALNHAYKKQYARSNHILLNALPLVETDVQNQHVILYNLAVNWYKMKNYQNAERYILLAKSFGDDFETQLLETFIDVKLGRLILAKEKLTLLSKSYPENIDVAIKLAEIYHREKDGKAANEVITNLIKNNPKAQRDRRVLKYQATKGNYSNNKK